MPDPIEPHDFTMTRLYVDGDLGEGQPLALSRDQAHYLGNVMRKAVGDEFLVFNGRDGEWLVEVKDLGKKRGIVEPIRPTRQQDGVPDLQLLFAPIKKAPLDFLVQKATELGVASLQPVYTHRTNVARVKLDRMQAHVIEAAEQSGRMTLPEVLEPTKLEDLLENWPADRQLIFCDEARDAEPMADALRAHGAKSASILIGPEGGFDPSERTLLKSLPNCLSVALGPRIMRADTAALAALALWQSVMGDLASPAID